MKESKNLKQTSLVEKDPKFQKIEIGRGGKFPEIRKIKLEPGRNFQKTEK